MNALEIEVMLLRVDLETPRLAVFFFLIETKKMSENLKYSYRELLCRESTSGKKNSSRSSKSMARDGFFSRKLAAQKYLNRITVATIFTN